MKRRHPRPLKAGRPPAPGAPAAAVPAPGPVVPAEDRIRDLERQLAECHAQLMEAMRTIHEQARAGVEAQRRAAALQRRADKQAERQLRRAHSERPGTPLTPTPGWGKPRLPSGPAGTLLGRDVESEFEMPAKSAPAVTPAPAKAQA